MWPLSVWIILFSFQGQWAVFDTGPFFTKESCEQKKAAYIQERIDYELHPIKFLCREYSPKR